MTVIHIYFHIYVIKRTYVSKFVNSWIERTGYVIHVRYHNY